MNVKFFAFLFISGLGMLVSCNSEAQESSLSVSEFEEAISQSNIQILDVRTTAEFQSGHIGDALLADWNNQKEFKKLALLLDKSKPVYTYCLSGVRSSAATNWLRQNGYTAYNLTGGINAWKLADKPIEQMKMVKQITLEEYMSQIPKDKTVLADISAVWCPPCKIMKPLIDSMAAANGGRFILVRIDGGEQTQLCKQLKVDGFPTLIIYKQGKESWRKQGIVDVKELAGKL